MQWGYQPWAAFQPPQPQSIAGVRFVGGIEEARSVPIPYGSRALLMDAGSDVFYVKSTDQAGASTIEAYRFERIEPEEREYVTREEFEELRRAYESVVRNDGQPTA